MSVASGLALLRESIQERKSEGAQAALVAQVLAGMGHKGKPEVQALPLEHGATMRVYMWADTPFGDALVLVTGPSVDPEILLGKELGTEPERGAFYVRGTPAAGRGVESVMSRVTKAMQVKVEKLAKVTATTAARREAQRVVARTPPVVVVAPPPVQAPAPVRASRAPRQTQRERDLATLQAGFAQLAAALK